jgi:hypothetical protein
MINGRGKAGRDLPGGTRAAPDCFTTVKNGKLCSKYFVDLDPLAPAQIASLNAKGMQA